MKKSLTIGLLAITCSAIGQPSSVVIPQGVKHIETVEKKGNELVIPYQKYELDNGLTLIIHEDHSDPIVHVDVTYHVGSAREEPWRSGFAHFFEHMMFQGSDNVADEEHFKTVSESGGNLNGTTNADRTNYFETVPSNQLETALWLEADRMGFFLDAVTQQKFEVQRATVKNERGQNYDNRPYGLIREKVAQALYPQTHPYHWPTIGYLEDLDRVSVQDLKQFFLRWYGPNNASLTVGGDVDPSRVLALVKKYFGSIPRGAAVYRQKPLDVKLDADRYISYEDNIRFPLLMMAYPTVPNTILMRRHWMCSLIFSEEARALCSTRILKKHRWPFRRR
jgi:zinc protease